VSLGGRIGRVGLFGRRRLELAGSDELGAYRVLRVRDDAPAVAGQFAMLSAAERWGGGEDERPFFGRAFSIARQADGESWYLLEDVGPGTRRLCELRAGEQVDVVGPLGRGFRAPADGRRALLVGGGVGAAPLAILQDELGETATSVLLGFRDREHAPGAELLRGARVATDDGSVGHHGLVTELLAAEIDSRDSQPLAVYACGPPPMLEAVRALCKRAGVPCQLALEAGMACGFGACFGCVVPRRDGGYLRVCVDGPVVDADLLERVEEPAAAAVGAGLAMEAR
jgi:dihydroorotate dehydrogenase electron transfer subunit